MRLDYKRREDKRREERDERREERGLSAQLDNLAV